MSNEFRKDRATRRAEVINRERSKPLPALPIFLWADGPDINGVIARYMFPVNGHIEYALIMVEEFDGDSVPMELHIEDKITKFFAYKRPLKDKIDKHIPAGARLVLKSENLVAKGFWVTYSWRPQI